MRVSLNEVQATAQKAAVGSGHAYGIAEELARATRWLCERGFRGVEKLLHALREPQAAGLQIREGDAQISLDYEGDCLFVASAAASIGDLALLAQQRNSALAVSCLSHPLLVIPYLFDVAQRTGVLQAQWKSVDGFDVCARAENGNLSLFAPESLTLFQARATDFICRFSETAEDPTSPCVLDHQQMSQRVLDNIAQGAEINDQAWQTLNELAHRTYVPISEESRLSGAGAGLTDND